MGVLDVWLLLYIFFNQVYRTKLTFNSMQLEGGACSVMAIVKGNGHGDMSTKPGRD